MAAPPAFSKVSLDWVAPGISTVFTLSVFNYTTTTLHYLDRLKPIYYIWFLTMTYIVTNFYY